jgi:hypothetical protein
MQLQRLLIKLHPQANLAAVNVRANLRPLFEPTEDPAALGLTADAAAWYVADVGDLALNPWDAAHGRIASALGIDESAVLFAEPDLPQSYPDQTEANPGGNPFAIKEPDCKFQDQYNDGRKPGPGFAWHLKDEFSQLASARAAVQFSDPGRTRIAHIDTGYDPNHSARPARMLRELERNFVKEDGTPNDATDPNRGFLLDQSGHGTGTSGILAGQAIPQNGNQPIGGAPDADVLPIRIANSVVLFYTSALVQAFNYAVQQKCDVITMSMGGLPSRAWQDAINAAYEAGICIVTASGDCIAGIPTHNTVYPARYHRVISACGVMADGTPYYNLPFPVLEGSWGPDSAMTHALAAYTPNTPWAKLGCRDIVDMTGAGTSSATPQIAAAAALWMEKYKAQLSRDWRRVEAARYALFRSARNTNRKYYGNGILRANAALTIAPNLNLPKTPADDDSFPFFRVITGLGVAEPPPRERMLNLELSQRFLMNRDMQEAVLEPEAEVIPNEALRKFMDAAIADKSASQTLRRALAARYPLLFGSPVPGVTLPDLAPTRAIPRPDPNSVIPDPVYRRLRAYSVDPSLSTTLETSTISEARLEIAWEDVDAGPVGEYIEIFDEDVDGTVYQPINLNDPRLIAQDGFAPAEGNPQFHQQMTYAVSMTTIAHFENAMGRRVMWRPRINPEDPFDDSQYAQRLRIRPHAFNQENAFYDPVEIALRFGYFRAAANDPGDHVPGSLVFTCLSHDIIAHETTHAILDGMHRRFNEPTNLDVLAFHEGFADVVALMQHFTMLDVLESQIAKSRGDLESETMLGSLAIQFGRAAGGRGALRDAIGSIDEKGVWRRLAPNPAAYKKIQTPHARGALLVAAIFDAFLAIYKARTVDLYRIYTGGTGILRPGAIHPDLVKRIAAEASKAATHVLHICVRALDYVPPVDITFGEYLRGIITADMDLVPDDTYGYRVAFVEAFRRRGIYPDDLDTLSVDTLRWQGVDLSEHSRRYAKILNHLKRFADQIIYIDDRHELFDRTRKERSKLQLRVKEAAQSDPGLAKSFGIDPALSFEVHELRRAERTDPDGWPHPQMIVAVTQQREIKVPGAKKSFVFHGGCTLVVDLKKGELKYAIRKRIDQHDREQRTIEFLEKSLKNPITAMLIDPNRSDRFAALHALADAGS